MPTPRTRIAWTVGLVLLLIAVAVVVVPRLIDEARVRTEVEGRLTTALGVPVTIRGPVRLRTGTSLEVDVADVTIAGTRGPGGEAVPPLAVVERIRASVESASLLAGPLRIGEVRVDGPRLHLHVDAAGRGNWEGLGGSAAADAAEPRAWSLDGLVIERGAVRHTDARSGADHELADWSLRVGRVDLPKPFDAETRFAARSGREPVATVELRTRVHADPSTSRYAIEALRVESELVQASGPLPLRLELQSLSYAAATDAATLSGLAVQAAGVRTRVDGEVRALQTAPVADLKVATDTFDPRAVLAQFGIEPPPMAGPDALTRAAFAAHVRYRESRVEIGDLAAVVDDTRLGGRIATTMAAPRRWTLDLVADRIVADRYLKPARLRDDSPVELPLEFLRDLDARGRLRVGELVSAGVRVRGVVIELGTDAGEGSGR